MWAKSLFTYGKEAWKKCHKPGNPQLYSSTSKDGGMNQLKTSEITNRQVLVSVIQNTNSSTIWRALWSSLQSVLWSAPSLLHVPGNSKGSRTWPVLRAFLTALTACGCPWPQWPFIMLRAISVCLLPPLAIYPPTTFSLLRRSEKERRHLPRQLLQTLHRRF